MVNPFRPWRRPGRLFLAAAHVAVGLPVAIVTFVVVVVMAALSIGLLPVFLLGVPIGWLTLMVSAGSPTYRVHGPASTAPRSPTRSGH